ncbi:MAG: hypothetical protein ACWA5A_10290 [Marinibacterium sp.]
MSNDRVALKLKLRDRMRAMEETELATALAHYEAHLKEARLDDREQHDNDDIADAVSEAELAKAFDHPVHTHQAKLAAIEEIDFGLTDTVRPGAVVVFNNRHFVVSVSTARFDCEGTTYMGISTQSPVYKAIEGLSKGDVFTLNGREIELQDVF